MQQQEWKIITFVRKLHGGHASHNCYKFPDISQDTNNLISFPTHILQQRIIVAEAPAENEVDQIKVSYSSNA